MTHSPHYGDSISIFDVIKYTKIMFSVRSSRSRTQCLLTRLALVRARDALFGLHFAIGFTALKFEINVNRMNEKFNRRWANHIACKAKKIVNEFNSRKSIVICAGLGDATVSNIHMRRTQSDGLIGITNHIYVYYSFSSAVLNFSIFSVCARELQKCVLVICRR